MADDGLLVNFAIGEDRLNTNTVFKGGRWKDRHQAKKSSRRPKEKPLTNGALTGVNALPTKPKDLTEDNDVSRPLKRQKLNEALTRGAHISYTTDKTREVVSSLFTYNPISRASGQTQPEDVPALSPSNAPLPAGLHNFTSLGLSQSLSTHLLTSLSLTAPTAIQKAAITQLLEDNSDAFIQAETGSGKTLAYLLPIIQRILRLSKRQALEEKDKQINRTSGLFALILAPTRELTHQISLVLLRLLRRLPWIVAGTVTGGSQKNHEKARLRKGLNILVATPGRLADHLDNTEVLDVSSVRWLVLDEGDRLMELGFEEEIKSIVQKLEERKGKGQRAFLNIEGLPGKRTTVLCSATMKMGVQKLGEISLKDAVHIKADLESNYVGDKLDRGTTGKVEEKESAFLAPAQLKQTYIIVPAKQRLVTLAALLKRTFARKGSVMKVIVFLSCADSVDFHFEAFAPQYPLPPNESTQSTYNIKSNTKSQKTAHLKSSPRPPAQGKTLPTRPTLPTIHSCPLLVSPTNPTLTLHKLHGSLPQPLRSATLASFTRTTSPSILLCTDVASRGLDFPNIDLVIEYDPPFSSDDHLHRVGRTARAGRKGQAICFLLPGAEEGYVSVLREGAGGGVVKGETAEDVLRKGFSPTTSPSQKDRDNTAIPDARWDDQATSFQLRVERWVVGDARATELGRKAFVSHVRAYATHVVAERAMFDVRELQLGHLAKAFALRERPGALGRREKGENMARGKKIERGRVGGRGVKRREEGEKSGKGDWREGVDTISIGQDATRRMRMKMREHMASAGEFNIG